VRRDVSRLEASIERQLWWLALCLERGMASPAWTIGCSLLVTAFSGTLHAQQRPAESAPIARPAAPSAPVDAATRGVRIDSVKVPASVGEQTRETLRDAVARALSDEKLDSPRIEYSVSVSLLQLRRYIGPDDQEPRLVCILDIALHDARGVLVGSLSGRASSSATDATATRDVLEAATRSTISRLPEALKLADKAQRVTAAPKHRGRVARR
jgi:hypothetical protein